MLVGKMLLVFNLVFLFGAKSQAQEEDEADVAGEEATPSDPSDGSSEGPPQAGELEKSAAPSPHTEVPEEAASDSSTPSDTAVEASSQPDPSAAPTETESSVSQPASGEGVVAGSVTEGEATPQEVPPSPGELTGAGTTGASLPADHTAQGVNPLVYVFGGFAGVIGLFSLYTFYRRKKTWDEISDAMRIDGGDAPLGSQPPSEFNTQDIAGISNTQVSKPISELND